MSNQDLLQRENRMLACLSSLPRRMLTLHGIDNVTEFVLHDLCHEHCFNFNKAAYFVDNGDFNCTKGVAGFSRDERFAKNDAIWEDPIAFSHHMKESAFNKRVRQMDRCSLKHLNDGHASMAAEMAHDLGFTNYAFCSWSMKHDNDGFVLYEKADVADTFADQYLMNGLSLLSFCPIF
ncbi:MAG TPA: hypothetical protein VLG71_03095 [Candidatus Limnocylindria bacterium]|nr:hypothetical protein [Candidatus Limnocylindria bacterium]